MRIHHLNCGTMCPFGGALMDGVSHGAFAHLVCHCLLIETDEGLVLVDTGIGNCDIARPHLRLSGFFRGLLRVQLEPEKTALRQIERLGFKADDVRHIVLTHLDFDHAGGLDDFPNAAVHLLKAENRYAHALHGFVGKRRYRPAQWGTESHWRSYGPGGEPWFGFECVRDLEGLPPEILLVPLVGHTWGHCGVAVETPAGWLLHAGDAYFYREEMDAERPHCTPGLAAYQKLMEVHRRARLDNQRRLRDLKSTTPGLTLHCAHDPVEFAELAGLAGHAQRTEAVSLNS